MSSHYFPFLFFILIKICFGWRGESTWRTAGPSLALFSLAAESLSRRFSRAFSRFNAILAASTGSLWGTIGVGNSTSMLLDVLVDKSAEMAIGFSVASSSSSKREKNKNNKNQREKERKKERRTGGSRCRGRGPRRWEICCQTRLLLEAGV